MQLRAPDRRSRCLWGFWGGSVEKNESLAEAVKRELTEELGSYPPINNLTPLHCMTSNDDGFEYTTFLATVDEEFLPTINHESYGYAWVNWETHPAPLHPGAKLVLQNPRVMSKIKTFVQQTSERTDNNDTVTN